MDIFDIISLKQDEELIYATQWKNLNIVTKTTALKKVKHIEKNKKLMFIQLVI